LWKHIRRIDTPWLKGSFLEAERLRPSRFWFFAFEKLRSLAKYFKNVTEIQLGTDWIFPHWDYRWTHMMLLSPIIQQNKSTLRMLHIRALPKCAAPSLLPPLQALLGPQSDCQLEELLFSDVEIDYDASKLIQNAKMPHLKRLYFFNCRVLLWHPQAGSSFCSKILKSSYTSHLTHLSVDLRCVRGAFRYSLKDTPRSNLKYLNLPVHLEGLLLNPMFLLPHNTFERDQICRDLIGYPKSIVHVQGVSLDSRLRYGPSQFEFIDLPCQTIQWPKDAYEFAQLMQKLPASLPAALKLTALPILRENDLASKILFHGPQTALLYYHLLKHPQFRNTAFLQRAAVLKKLLPLTKELGIEWDAQDWLGETILHKSVSSSFRHALLKQLSAQSPAVLSRLVNAVDKKGRPCWSVLYWAEPTIHLAASSIRFRPAPHSKLPLITFISRMSRDALRYLLQSKCVAFTLDILMDLSVVRQICLFEKDSKNSVVVPLVQFARSLCHDDATLKSKLSFAYVESFGCLVPSFLRRENRAAVRAIGELSREFSDVPWLMEKIEKEYPAVFKEIRTTRF
jgi:hypothetical protein